MATIVWVNEKGETVRSHTLDPGGTAKQIQDKFGGTIVDVERPAEKTRSGTSYTPPSSSKPKKNNELDPEPEPEKKPINVPVGNIPHLDTSKGVGITVIEGNKEFEPIYKAPTYIPSVSHGTLTPEQLTGGKDDFVPKKKDEGFYAPNIIQDRQEKMALKKGHFIGRDPDTKEPQYIQKTSYSVIHDYEPGFDDTGQRKIFDKAESNISGSLTVSQSNIETINKAKELIPEVYGFIKQLENIPKDTMVKYSSFDEQGKETIHDVKASEALVVFRKQLTDLQNTSSKLQDTQNTIRDLEYQQDLISGYRKHGYKLEETDTGYKVTTPTATEVFEWKHPDKKQRTDLISSASFLASPLSVQTVFSGIQYAVTGDEDVRKAEQERLSEYALGLDRSLKRGDFFAHVVGSPAMVEGVYIPALTLGASSLLSTGAGALSPYVASGAGKISSGVGKVIPTTLKLVVSDTKQFFTPIVKGGAKLLGTKAGKQVVKYSLYAGLQGKDLIETATLRPEEFGGVLGRSLFNWELQWASMEAGFRDTKLPTQKKDFIGLDIKSQTNIPSSVKKTDVFGRFDVVQKKTPPTDILYKGRIIGKTDDLTYTIFQKTPTDDFMFGGSGKFLVKQESVPKPIKVTVYGKGFGKTTRDVLPGIDYTESIGKFRFTWTEKKGLKVIEHTSFRPVKANSYILGKTDDISLLYSISKTPGKLEHTIGESFTSVKDVAKIGESKISFYTSQGEFTNILDDVIGKQRVFGLSTSLKDAGKESVDIGRKTAQELVKVTKSATVNTGGSLAKVAVGSGEKIPILTGTKLISTPQGADANPITSKSVSVSKTDSLVTVPNTKSLMTPKTKPAKTIKYFTPTKGSTILSGSTLETKPSAIQETNLISIADTKQISRQRQKYGLGLITDNISILDTKQDKILGSSPLIDTGLDIIEREDYFTPQAQFQNIDIMQKQEQRQGLISRTTQKQAQMLDTDLTTINTIQTTPTTPNIPTIPYLFLPDEPKGKVDLIRAKEQRVKGYDVLVKERSMYHGKITKPTKFKKINVAPLTRSKAKALGATIADETSAISFKITKSNGKAKSSNQPSKSFDSLKHKFTKKGNVYIEKNKFRLDSPGEQKEISLLGRQTRKNNVLSRIDLKIKNKKINNKTSKRKKNVQYY